MADESKKTSRLVRQFRSEGSAELTPRVTEKVVAIVFTTPANGKSIEVPVKSFPASIQAMSLAYGLNATIGNALGNLDKDELEDPDVVMETLQDRVKTLQAGQWASERTGGGRPSMVWQA